MSTADTQKQITDLFTQIRHCADQLHDSLEAELDYLKNNNAEQLLNNIQRKQELMDQLMQLEQQRKSITASQQIKSKADYLNWLDRLDSTGILKNQWNELGQLIKDCQKMNATNGVISDKMAEASIEVLNILSGNKLPADSTYSSSGRKNERVSSLHNTTA